MLHRAPPGLGEQTDEVLAGLKLDAAPIAEERGGVSLPPMQMSGPRPPFVYHSTFSQSAHCKQSRRRTELSRDTAELAPPGRWYRPC